MQKIAPEKSIFFNELKEHLLEQLGEKYNIPKKLLLLGEAEKLTFKTNSGIFMLGVGGLLIKRCLENYLKVKDEMNLKSLTFVLGPTYYQLELKDFISESPFEMLKMDFVWENGRGNELYLVHYPPKSRPFDERIFWNNCINETPDALNYLRKRVESLRAIRQPSPLESEYLCFFSDIIAHF